MQGTSIYTTERGTRVCRQQTLKCWRTLEIPCVSPKARPSVCLPDAAFNYITIHIQTTATDKKKKEEKERKKNRWKREGGGEEATRDQLNHASPTLAVSTIRWDHTDNRLMHCSTSTHGTAVRTHNPSPFSYLVLSKETRCRKKKKRLKASSQPKKYEKSLTMADAAQVMPFVSFYGNNCVLVRIE